MKPTDLAAQDYRQRKNKVFNMMAAVNWTVIKNLVYRSEFGLDLTYDVPNVIMVRLQENQKMSEAIFHLENLQVPKAKDGVGQIRFPTILM